MPLLFAYGTLVRPDVQRSTFGRLLNGGADSLPGYEVSALTLACVQYQNATFNGKPDSLIPGHAYEVTEEELKAADAYELDADYKRKLVTLASGKQAWIYLHGE
jgi:gamma-glutamylcyclotransferase (GGCT)/AIG2-like uncharacterized protein YtfP